MAAKQKMIADELGLSVMTISRALRNHPDVSEETKQRVIQKALELNYNKTPALGRSEISVKRIAVVLYDAPERAGRNLSLLLGEGVYQSIFRSIQNVCRKKHVETVVEMPPWEEAPIVIQNRGVNGALLLGRYTKSLVEKFGSIPTISVSSFREGAAFPQVVARNNQGMREMTEYLIQKGHKKILFLQQEDKFTELFVERLRGYLATMTEHGLTPAMRTLPNHDVMPLRASDLGDISGFTALVCASDAVAFAVKNVLDVTGVRCPEDISIVGFDNAGFHSSMVEWLTTYDPNWEEMGRLAVSLLLSCPQELSTPIQVMTSGRIVERKSVLSCA